MTGVLRCGAASAVATCAWCAGGGSFYKERMEEKGKYELLPPLSEEEFQALKNDIAINGVREPIIVDEDGNILDGHHRHRIDPTVKRIVVTGKTEAQKKAFVFNANLTRCNLSPAQKKAALKEQKKIALELKLDGNTQADIATLLGVSQQTVSNWLSVTNTKDGISHTPDARVKIPKGEHEAIYKRMDDGDTQEQIAADYGVDRTTISRIVTKVGKQIQLDLASAKVEGVQEAKFEETVTVNSGDWWALGNHLIYCGDTSTDQFKNMISDGATLAFADPPYGVNKAGWDGSFYWEHDYLIDKANIVAVTPGIVSIFTFARLTTMPYVWSIACWIENGMTRGAVGYGNWIYIALFSKDSVYAQAQDVIRATIKTSDKDTTIHESRKPSELLITLIQRYSKENDTVIDPFLGSGTTLFACEELGRKCIGGEINNEYFKEIILRWQKQSGNKAMKVLV